MLKGCCRICSKDRVVGHVEDQVLYISSIFVLVCLSWSLPGPAELFRTLLEASLVALVHLLLLLIVVVVVGGWWLVVGGWWWLVVDWWLVGGWLVVVGCWLFVAGSW